MAFTTSVTLVTTYLSLLFGFVTASHFRGTVISWRPVDPVKYNGVIEITHRIAWRNNRCDVASCNQNSIDEGTIFSSGGGTLFCWQDCSGTIATMSYVCTDVSTSENWAAGQRSYEYNMNRISYFEASFCGNAWISLVSGGGRWEVRVKGNLTRPPDTGRVNSSPVTAILPVVKLKHGCNHTIVIPDLVCKDLKSTLCVLYSVFSKVSTGPTPAAHHTHLTPSSCFQYVASQITASHRSLL